MGDYARLRRLHRAGRVRTIVAEFDAGQRRDSARRMSDVPWLADALAAVGRIGAADRFVRARLEDAHNPRLDPAPVARLQLARLRIAVRAVQTEPAVSGRLAWAARSWLADLPAAPDAMRAEFDALGGLVDGLLAERADRLDDALTHLSAAAALPLTDPHLARRIRSALDRCVARREPARALERRQAEVGIADDPQAVTRWLARIVARSDEEALIDGLLAALDETASVGGTRRDAARAALRRLANPRDLEHWQAVWRSALHRRQGRTEAALAALAPLGRAPTDSPWALARDLCAFELRPRLKRQDAEALMRWWNHPDGAVAMVARTLVARALRDAGDLSGSIEAGRAAAGRIRAAERSSMRWYLPSAWPGRPEALVTLYGVVGAVAASDLPMTPWCIAVVERIRRAMFAAREIDRQD